ncbi:MAG: N-ethylammeline chlorohydrolase [Candidatus Methanoperedens nitroreducens]|uniref:N-ethylammeline chlorohydrolase n=1 Tax=Candidatus Methanoperedens nitratireducens TaxID=1392998 RepID=A0A0N8KRF0_9EURY|nr:amidohydrolase [Candidatus Methanoperedens sp. BLZ2]KAB2944532.1 MAG: amidohydrolase [Candidatus Methanoperedens sp.]KPQ44754.1 MAG: N-ethylammeline chlorohydrolase [Candidatus Methanoperedens sp. BLZ1]MBZ0176265.1 amidohydrolase [Candidatus Methanoperedens nitroreducens]CAG0974617.1 5-methylthioadenosine/S-adenosylhomocysteine deaminase [Methanosarcinales archaeon]MCX9077198.1 amidohydrolase [Candidatus Methanoperedens sp.]
MPWGITNVNLLINGDLVRNKTIVIDFGNIQYIGSNEIAGKRYKLEYALDGKSKLALPGLINGHTHFCHGSLRGTADNIALNSWLEKINKYRSNVKKSDIKVYTNLICLELIKSGTTAFVSQQNPIYIQEAMKACGKFGIRGVFAPIIIDKGAVPDKLLSASYKTFKNFDELEKICENSRNRLKVVYGPMSLYNCSSELLKEVSEASITRNNRVHIHLGETKEGAIAIKKKYKMSEVEVLKSIGLLKKTTSLVHCIHVKDNDLHKIKSADASIIHCPTSNSKSGDGIAPISQMLEMGINVGLGTDGPASNGSQSMLWEMKFAVLLQRVKKNKFPSHKALDMATINNAKSMGINDMGSLKIGNKADIVLIDLKAPNMIPWENVAFHVIYGCNDRNVSDVIVNGEILLKNQKILCVDEKKIINEAIRSLPSETNIL